jgi:hypothetical protein
MQCNVELLGGLLNRYKKTMLMNPVGLGTLKAALAMPGKN